MKLPIHGRPALERALPLIVASGHRDPWSLASVRTVAPQPGMGNNANARIAFKAGADLLFATSEHGRPVDKSGGNYGTSPSFNRGVLASSAGVGVSISLSAEEEGCLSMADAHQDLRDDDLVAIKLAIERVLADPDESRRSRMQSELDSVKLGLADWKDVGSFAVYSEQMRSLSLSEWEYPPVWVPRGDVENIIAAGEHHRCFKGAVILKQMLALGISEYHPAPLQAIATAKKRGAA